MLIFFMMICSSKFYSDMSFITWLLLVTVSTSALADSMFPDAEPEYRKQDQQPLELAERRRILKYVGKTTPELIEAQGYPAEIHTVVTKDGYILEMHRIPHGMKNITQTIGPRPAVYLQHCLTCSSAIWIMNTPDRALAYILADAGYDVWMGNARGNTYSKKHRYLLATSELFWQFSWAEIGKYDDPAMIDHVLNTTKQDQLYYVGFSMGTTTFFTLMNYRPEYNDKIRGMVALAPVAYAGHTKEPWRSIFPHASLIEELFRMAGIHELLPSKDIIRQLLSFLCTRRRLASLCQEILTVILGPNPEQQYKDYLPVLLSHTPAGFSVRSLIHFFQIGREDKFQEFDHGFFGNLRHYGQATPPPYDLSKVTAPVAAFYSENDWLATPIDVQRALSEMPNVVFKFIVRDKNFSHADFIWARNAVSEVYQPLVKVLQRF